jgi:serine protease Do
MIWCRYLRVILFGLLAAFPGLAYSQYADVNFEVSHINNCVYEVIVPKPPDGSITYEKPLPMDLLPFQVRNDKYYPIGTAFASSKDEFITAGHVMNPGVRSQFKEVAIRDIKGNVFSVDRIVKFSSRRDFVVFTVKGRLSSDYLEANSTPEISEKVFAVGNALGQGVAIRDGLYTSSTPEEIDGKWNWIRFSAAASPGNSGGPLLDKSGKVIGLVLSKSRNENLNFALPISEVNKDYDNNAEIYGKLTHALEIFDFVKTGTLDTMIKLPMAYADFDKAYTDKINEFNSKLRKELLIENKANTFPNGSGSNKMMYASSKESFPQLITRREDGSWEAHQPEKINKAELDSNGRIAHGVSKITAFARIEKPDNISLKDLCSDSKVFMDFMLKAVNINREVGPEKVRITSLGKADSETVHTDAYGRKWLVKTWPIPYNDTVLAAFILPVPDGCVVMLKAGQTGATIDDHVEDMRVLSDFVNVAYGGTFKQWREYLDMKDLAPTVLSNIQIRPNNDIFSYKSNKLEVTADLNTMKIRDNTFLIIGFGFHKDNQSVIWNVSTLVLMEDKFDKTGYMVLRHIKPIDDNDKYADFWSRVIEGRKPFDKQISIKNEETTISSIWKSFQSTKANGDCGTLYSITRGKRGVISQGEIEPELDAFMRNVAVHEE